MIGILVIYGCNKIDEIKGPNQYVVFPYIYKPDGSNELKDSLYLSDFQDTVVNYGMALTPLKNGKIFMLAFKLPPPPTGINNVVLYLYDIDEKKILFSDAVTYTGTAFTRIDLTVKKEEIPVVKDKRYIICFTIPLAYDQINSNSRLFVNTFIVGRKNQMPIMPFTQGDIKITGFYKKYGKAAGIPDLPVSNQYLLFGLFDIGYYSIQ